MSQHEHDVRPAYYALARGGWRDYVTLLHPPYTLWHLSYVVVGGCLATTVSWERLGLTVLAFALAMGIGAHALDELHGRPLATHIPSGVLAGLAAVSVGAACVIGVAVALDFSLWLLAPVVLGAVLVPAYNLELAGGRLHTDLVFAVSWGAFPVVTGYLACSGTVRVEAVLAAAWATLLSLAQRRLSTPVRRLRRQTAAVSGALTATDGTTVQIDRETLIAAPEAALRLLAWSSVLVAAALAAARL